jgi:hypothetical protein
MDTISRYRKDKKNGLHIYKKTLHYTQYIQIQYSIAHLILSLISRNATPFTATTAMLIKLGHR